MVSEVQRANPDTQPNICGMHGIERPKNHDFRNCSGDYRVTTKTKVIQLLSSKNTYEIGLH